LSAATTSTHKAYAAARAIPPFLFVAPARHCLPAFIVLPSTTNQHTMAHSVVSGYLMASQRFVMPSYILQAHKAVSKM